MENSEHSDNELVTSSSNKTDNINFSKAILEQFYVVRDIYKQGTKDVHDAARLTLKERKQQPIKNVEEIGELVTYANSLLGQLETHYKKKDEMVQGTMQKMKYMTQSLELSQDDGSKQFIKQLLKKLVIDLEK